MLWEYRDICSTPHGNVAQRQEAPVLETVQCEFKSHRCYQIKMLTDRQHEILTGLMLGDGHLHKTKKIAEHNASLVVERSSIDKDFLFDNYSDFKELCLSSPLSYSRVQVVNNVEGVYHYTRFFTRSLPVISRYYDVWYPGGEKIVPTSLKLTPLTIAIWLADDAYVEPKRLPHRFFLRFCSEGFSETENEFLAELLSKRYGEKFRLDYLGLNKKGNKKYRVVANDYAARPLLEEIDPYFPESMIRKAYWRNPETRFYSDQPKRTYSNIKNRCTFTDNEKLIFNFIKSKGTVAIQELEQYLMSISYSKTYSKKLITLMINKQQIVNVGTKNNSKYSLTVLI